MYSSYTLTNLLYIDGTISARVWQDDSDKDFGDVKLMPGESREFELDHNYDFDNLKRYWCYEITKKIGDLATFSVDCKPVL